MPLFVQVDELSKPILRFWWHDSRRVKQFALSFATSAAEHGHIAIGWTVEYSNHEIVS